MFSFIKMMVEAGCDVTEYVKIGTITKAQYQELTGKEYAGGEP